MFLQSYLYILHNNFGSITKNKPFLLIFAMFVHILLTKMLCGKAVISMWREILLFFGIIFPFVGKNSHSIEIGKEIISDGKEN